MKILFPTDFSPHANQVLGDAIRLCNQMGAELHLIHVFQDIKSTRKLSSMKEILEADAEKEMQQLAAEAKLQLQKPETLQTTVSMGDTIDIIKAYVKKFNIDLILMGTQGLNSLKTVLFGTVTGKLVAHITVPVLAIPMGAEKKLRDGRILLALDDKDINESDGFSLAKKIMEALDKHMDVLHVIPENNRELVPFDINLRNVLGSTMGELFIISGNDPIIEIKKFAEKNGISLLVMIKRKHSFLEKLFFKGHISEELAMTNIPILVLSE